MVKRYHVIIHRSRRTNGYIMEIDKEMGTRSIQNFGFSSTTWFDTVLLSICFAMSLVSCESVKKWPSYGQMKFWWTKRKRRQNCQRYSSKCIHRFEYFLPNPFQIVVLVLAVILMGGSSNSDQNWLRNDSLKLAIQNWKTVYGIFYISSTVRHVASQYCPNSTPNYY